MRINSVIRTIATLHSTHRPLMIWGPPGIGKSAAVRQACLEHLGPKYGSEGGTVLEYGQRHESPQACIGLHDIRLSQCDPVDIGGLPAKGEGGHMVRLCPDWFPATDRPDLPDYGILFLDEIVSASRSAQAAAYQISLDRVCAGKLMKPGWSVVMAGNRISDGGVVNPMPTPLANRMVHVDAESNADDWEEWAMKNEMPLDMIAFIRYRPELLNTFEKHVTEKHEGHTFASERAWHIVGDMVNNGDVAEDLMLELFEGAVGKGPAVEYMAFRQVWADMPDPDEVLLNPQSAPVPDRSDAKYAIATALATRAKPDNMDAVVTYYGRLDPEFSVLGVKDVSRHNRECMHTKAFMNWASENAELLG